MYGLLGLIGRHKGVITVPGLQAGWGHCSWSSAPVHYNLPVDGTTVTRTGMLVPGCEAIVVTYSRSAYT